MYDIAVVGAGPAGSYISFLLSREGLRTALIEREKLPRHKPCGGSVTYDDRGVLKEFKELRRGDESLTIEEVRRTKVYFLTEELFEYSRHSLQFLRSEFDHFLARKATEAGADLFEKSRVRDVRFEGDMVVVGTGSRTFEAKAVVGADGVNSVVARKSGLNPSWDEDGLALTMSMDVKGRRGAVEGNEIYLGFAPKGYCWIFPKREYLNAGIIIPLAHAKNLRTSFQRFCRVRGLKKEGTRVDAALIPMRTLPRSYARGVVLIGDAGGFADPLTGAGIRLGMLTAEKAAEALLEASERGDFSESSLQRYEEELASVKLALNLKRRLTFLASVANSPVFEGVCRLGLGKVLSFYLSLRDPNFVPLHG